MPYQSHKYRPLLPNAQWPIIVRDTLAGEPRARAILWEEVQYFVTCVVRLPIGPLNDDDDARSEIALRVLQKLEANASLHLKEWLARQVRKQDNASFWGLVKMIARSTAIDFARTSRRNVARRGQNFQWIQLDCVDPFVLAESLGSPRSYFACASEQEIEERFAELQRALREEDAAMVELWDDDEVTRALGSGAHR